MSITLNHVMSHQIILKPGQFGKGYFDSMILNAWIIFFCLSYRKPIPFDSVGTMPMYLTKLTINDDIVGSRIPFLNRLMAHVESIILLSFQSVWSTVDCTLLLTNELTLSWTGVELSSRKSVQKGNWVNGLCTMDRDGDCSDQGDDDDNGKSVEASMNWHDYQLQNNFAKNVS